MCQGGLSVGFRITWSCILLQGHFLASQLPLFIHRDPAGLVFPSVCLEVGDFSACLTAHAGHGGLGNQALCPHSAPPLTVGP